MTRRVLRWEVPVDDEWHQLDVLGSIVHVDCRKPGVVEFWTDGDDDRERPLRRSFCVFGTGQPVTPSLVAKHRGTALDGHFVWHLFEIG